LTRREIGAIKDERWRNVTQASRSHGAATGWPVRWRARDRRTGGPAGWSRPCASGARPPSGSGPRRAGCGCRAGVEPGPPGGGDGDGPAGADQLERGLEDAGIDGRREPAAQKSFRIASEARPLFGVPQRIDGEREEAVSKRERARAGIEHYPVVEALRYPRLQ